MELHYCRMWGYYTTQSGFKGMNLASALQWPEALQEQSLVCPDTSEVRSC
jgi:hypothetical protein